MIAYSEELAVMKTHRLIFRELLEAGGEVGKKPDFAAGDESRGEHTVFRRLVA